MLVAAGEQCGTCGCANGRCVKFGVAQTIVGQAVESWRGNHAAECGRDAKAHVINKIRTTRLATKQIITWRSSASLYSIDPIRNRMNAPPFCKQAEQLGN